MASNECIVEDYLDTFCCSDSTDSTVSAMAPFHSLKEAIESLKFLRGSSLGISTLYIEIGIHSHAPWIA
jgi:hypothetical protein